MRCKGTANNQKTEGKIPSACGKGGNRHMFYWIVNTGSPTGTAHNWKSDRAEIGRNPGGEGEKLPDCQGETAGVSGFQRPLKQIAPPAAITFSGRWKLFQRAVKPFFTVQFCLYFFVAKIQNKTQKTKWNADFLWILFSLCTHNRILPMQKWDRPTNLRGQLGGKCLRIKINSCFTNVYKMKCFDDK